MAYKHEDDYRRGKLIRKLKKSEKPIVSKKEQELLGSDQLAKLNKPTKKGIFKLGCEKTAHSERQKARRGAKRYKELTCDYTKGR